MNWRLFTILSLLLGAAGVLLAQAPQSRPSAQAEAPTTLRVGAWNIEWLGYPDRRKGPDQDPEHIAQYLLENKVDVVALEEVSFNEGTEADARNKTITAALAFIKQKTGQEWKHILFPKFESGGEAGFEKHQWTGVAWNTAKVKLVGEPFKIPVRRAGANKAIWQRWPHAVKFSIGEGKTDLVLIPVHMKSNFGGSEVAIPQRAEEAKALVRALGEVANKFTDDDLVILGDFNMLKASETGHARFSGNGLKDLNAADEPTWIKDNQYAAAPFDRIFVPEEQPEFKASKMVVAKSVDFLKNTRWPGTAEEKFRHYVSDHWMVVTDVTIQDDDD